MTCQGMRCFSHCYAMKGRCASPATQNAWAENWLLFSKTPDHFFGEIERALSRKRKPGYFRWHVGGDIPSQSYLEGIRWLARTNRGWRFALYTKRFDLDWKDALGTPNLHIRFSRWPSLGINPPKGMAHLPSFWTCSSAPFKNDCLKCPGSCADCRACWNPKPRVIWIPLH
jgi:hypothetical protein